MIRKALQMLGLAPKPHPDTVERKYFRVSEQRRIIGGHVPRETDKPLGSPPTSGTAVQKDRTYSDPVADTLIMGMILSQALDNGATNDVFSTTDAGWCGGLGSDVSSGSDQSCDTAGGMD